MVGINFIAILFFLITLIRNFKKIGQKYIITNSLAVYLLILLHFSIIQTNDYYIYEVIFKFIIVLLSILFLFVCMNKKETVKLSIIDIVIYCIITLFVEIFFYYHFINKLLIENLIYVSLKLVFISLVELFVFLGNVREHIEKDNQYSFLSILYSMIFILIPYVVFLYKIHRQAFLGFVVISYFFLNIIKKYLKFKYINFVIYFLLLFINLFLIYIEFNV